MKIVKKVLSAIAKIFDFLVVGSLAIRDPLGYSIVMAGREKKASQ